MGSRFTKSRTLMSPPRRSGCFDALWCAPVINVTTWSIWKNQSPVMRYIWLLSGWMIIIHCLTALKIATKFSHLGMIPPILTIFQMYYWIPPDNSLGLWKIKVTNYISIYNHMAHIYIYSPVISRFTNQVVLHHLRCRKNFAGTKSLFQWWHLPSRCRCSTWQHPPGQGNYVHKIK